MRGGKTDIEDSRWLARGQFQVLVWRGGADNNPGDVRPRISDSSKDLRHCRCGDRAWAMTVVQAGHLADDTWQRGSTDGEIFTVIRDGIGPDFAIDSVDGPLTAEEIWNVINYLKSLGGSRCPSAVLATRAAGG